MKQNDFTRPQLLDPRFDLRRQPILLPDYAQPLRFVDKLHHASRLHHDFRLECCGTLFSLVLMEPLFPEIGRPQEAIRVGDHDLRYLLNERRIPAGQYGAGPVLVYDHGTYRPVHQTELSDDLSVYKQLLAGRLEFELDGIRDKGIFLLQGQGKHWILTRLSGSPDLVRYPADMRSVISGRNLSEIR